MGGAGSAVNECLLNHGVSLTALNLGLPDRYIDHGKPAEQLRDCALDAEGIEASIRTRLARQQSGIKHVV
jgi:1-deoxy-D-xylulose-5-phosphate synthase